MKLQFRYPSKDEVPAQLAPHYVERDGAFFLDAEGAVDKSRLDEIRNSNAALTRERDELRQRFDGIDPDQVRKLAEEKRQLEEAQQLKAGEFEKVLDTRIKGVRGELEKKVATLTSERDALNGRLSTIQIDQGILSAATKRGLRATALPDITARGRAIFKLVNGVPLALEADGQSIRAGKDGASPLTVDEWIDSQVSEAPHLFETSTGTGVQGGAVANASGNRTVKNPFRKETWNLTEQMRLQKSNPQLAAALKSAA
jgi:hypothetical protein